MLRDAAIGAALTLAVLAVALALLTARVEGVSMLPTLEDGDVLLVDRLGPRLQPPARGDIVLVLQPNGVPAVKRVIGIPGDSLEIDGAHRDAGDPIPHPAVLVRPGGRGGWLELREPYLEPGWVRPDFCCDAAGRDAGPVPRPVTLAPGEFFVLGDNRNVSKDSRSFGLVRQDRVLGRVLLRYWPPRRAGGSGSGPDLFPA